MTSATNSSHLDTPIDHGNRLALRVLQPLSVYYDRDDVEEVVMNRPQEIWTKPRGSDWQRQDAPELTYDYIAQKLCLVLANINGARFRQDELPIVSCELPGLPYRFQAMVGRNVKYDASDRRGVALSIRSLKASTSITLKHYGLDDQTDLPGLKRLFDAIDLDAGNIQRISEAARRGYSILVSGATSSGKTTLLNQVIRLIPERARVIAVEDARELSVPHPNRVNLMVPRNAGVNAIGWNEILDAIVRLTPDYIVCGEVSIHNAGSIFSLMGKGHPVFSTVHAATPQEAVRAFINNMAASGQLVDRTVMQETLEAQIGCIIQLDRHTDGRRRVVDIVFPAQVHQEHLRRRPSEPPAA